MAIIDLSSEFKFKHLMSHTLPGFFSAITLFILIDVMSPLNFTSMIIKDLTVFATFLGFIILIGTIIGIILDGIHHSIIEDMFFDNQGEIVRIRGIRDKWIKKCEGYASGIGKEEFKDLELTRHYSFKTIESKLLEINNFVIEDYYSYSEFYSNTCLSLIPFSIVVPFYLMESFQIPWRWSVVFGFCAFVLAPLCLYCSYTSYKNYAQVINSIMFGYVKEKGVTSNPTEVKGNLTVGGNLKVDFKGA